MKTETTTLLQCPVCAGNLSYDGPTAKQVIISGDLVCMKNGHRFPVADGIPNFLESGSLQGLNRKYAGLYSLIARFYDSSFFIASYVRRQFWPSGEDKARREIIDCLELKRGDNVLETGIGTGANIPYLLERADDLAIFGNDIAQGMLQQCARQLKDWGQEAELFSCAGEVLPFQDEAFDVVFHVGGINAFSNKQAAVDEMIRTAKPGSRLVIADEKEELANESSLLSRTGLRVFFGRQLSKEILSFRVEEMLDLVPAEMQEVQMETIWDGKGYLLSFRKPLRV